MVCLTIDGKVVEAEKGTKILHAAESVGIKIPTLCYIKDLLPDGSCRMCMVEIESRGRTKMETACTAEVAEGLIVTTNSEKVRNARRNVLDMLLSNHKTDCFSCPGNTDCKLQDLCYEYGIQKTTYEGEITELPIDDSNPFFTYNPNICILCHRCVNTCHKIVGRGAIDTMERGFDSVIGTPFNVKLSETICESCGSCVQACPTGALTMKTRKGYRKHQITKEVLTTCPHCATGCQLYLQLKDDVIVDVKAANGPSNKGLLCVKGRTQAFNFVQSPERIKYPLIKNSETGEFEKASWDEALDLVASRLSEIKNTSGSDALAGLACTCSTNEEIYMMQKMVRCAFGTNNIDFNKADKGQKLDIIMLVNESANEKGAYDMGATPDCLPGGKKVEDVEKVWGVKLNSKQGMNMSDILSNAKGLYVCGEVNDPKALEKIDFVVANELFMNETAKNADVILPSASYAEKDGTFTNKDGLVQKITKAVEPKGEAKLDTDIFTSVMNKMGYNQPELTADEIMDEIKSI